jgi:hypothetical protein
LCLLCVLSVKKSTTEFAGEAQSSQIFICIVQLITGF